MDSSSSVIDSSSTIPLDSSCIESTLQTLNTSDNNKHQNANQFLNMNGNHNDNNDQSLSIDIDDSAVQTNYKFPQFSQKALSVKYRERDKDSTIPITDTQYEPTQVQNNLYDSPWNKHAAIHISNSLDLREEASKLDDVSFVPETPESQCIEKSFGTQTPYHPPSLLSPSLLTISPIVSSSTKAKRKKRSSLQSMPMSLLFQSIRDPELSLAIDDTFSSEEDDDNESLDQAPVQSPDAITLQNTQNIQNVQNIQQLHSPPDSFQTPFKPSNTKIMHSPVFSTPANQEQEAFNLHYTPSQYPHTFHSPQNSDDSFVLETPKDTKSDDGDSMPIPRSIQFEDDKKKPTTNITTDKMEEGEDEQPFKFIIPQRLFESRQVLNSNNPSDVIVIGTPISYEKAPRSKESQKQKSKENEKSKSQEENPNKSVSTNISAENVVDLTETPKSKANPNNAKNDESPQKTKESGKESEKSGEPKSSTEFISVFHKDGKSKSDPRVDTVQVIKNPEPIQRIKQNKKEVGPIVALANVESEEPMERVSKKGKKKRIIEDDDLSDEPKVDEANMALKKRKLPFGNDTKKKSVKKEKEKEKPKEKTEKDKDKDQKKEKEKEKSGVEKKSKRKEAAKEKDKGKEKKSVKSKNESPVKKSRKAKTKVVEIDEMDFEDSESAYDSESTELEEEGESINNTPKKKRIQRKISAQNVTPQEGLDSLQWVKEANESVEIPFNNQSPNKVASRKKAKEVQIQIFKGMSFVITGLPEKQEKCLDTSVDEDSEEQVEGYPSTHDEIVQIITSNGGHVVESNRFFAHTSQNAKKNNSQDKPPNLLLVTNKVRRTLKYIFAVSIGVPCISYQWVVECCFSNQILPLKLYTLPSGELLNGKSVTITEASDEVLSNLRIEVVGTASFREGWKNVLRVVGARVVQRLFTPQEQRIDAILTDLTPSDLIVRKSQELEIPLLSTEWLIQSILEQKVQEFRSHPHFCLEFEKV